MSQDSVKRNQTIKYPEKMGDTKVFRHWLSENV